MADQKLGVRVRVRIGVRIRVRVGVRVRTYTQFLYAVCVRQP